MFLKLRMPIKEIRTVHSQLSSYNRSASGIAEHQNQALRKPGIWFK